MGIQYTRRGGKPANGQSYRDVTRRLSSIYEDEMAEAGQDAQEQMMSYFRMQGTGKSWSAGPWGQGGTGDRVDSGDMKRDLSVRVYRGSGVGLDVGWVHNFQDYYRYQDEGFTARGFRRPSNRPGGDVVEGMGLTAHMSEWLRGRVDQALDRAEERIQREL